MSRVRFDVGGQAFSISKDLLDSGPRSRLSTFSTKSEEPAEIDRPRDSFGAILNWYITGQLHIPPNVCPGEFKTEMEYWNIDVQCLSDCCYYKYQSFLEDQAALRQFRERAFKDNIFSSGSSFIGKLRSRIWSVIDYRERTVISRIYFVLCLLMVLLSIITLALSTERHFQRTMTNCERLEYMESTDMADIDLFLSVLGPDCQSQDLPSEDREHSDLLSGPVSPYPNYDDDFEYEDDYIYLYVPEPMNKTPSEGNSNDTDLKSSLIVGSGRKTIKLPNLKIPIYTMFVLEIVTLVFFTIDLTIRLSTCPSLFAYFKSVVNILDAAALICTYLHLITIFMRKQDMYKDGWLDLLQYIQILRALRLLRVVKNVKASRVLIYSFRQNIRDLFIICIYIIVCMCVFASIFYITEGKPNIRSIPRAWYYTIITLTTVGYGDTVPKSPFGKALSCLCAITGLLLFALTIPVLANNFLTLYKYAYMEHRGENDMTNDKKNIGKKKITV